MLSYSSKLINDFNIMICPKCKVELKEFTSGSLKLDKCESCGGVWFDKNELKKVIDKRDKDLDWVHLDLWNKKEKFIAKGGKRVCPFCKKILLTLQYNRSGVEVDACVACGGIWLDKGEMEKIVDYLERSLDQKTVPEYIREIIKEGDRAIARPERGAIEAHHILILAKLLQYRILAEHPFIRGLIDAIPKINA